MKEFKQGDTFPSINILVLIFTRFIENKDSVDLTATKHLSVESITKSDNLFFLFSLYRS